MKLTIILILTILSFCYTHAQAPAIEWQKTFGGTGIDAAGPIQITTDGGYVVTGISKSIDGDVTGNHGDYDYWVVKIDMTGTIQWQKSIGGSGNDYAYAIDNTSDGGYIIAGYSGSTDGDVTENNGSFDYWVVKLDALGTVQWQKSLGGIGFDIAKTIQTTSDGGYIVAGNSSYLIGNHGGNDYWVVKLDAIGTVQWQKSLGGSSEDFAQYIQTTTDGGYVVVGYSGSIDGDVIGNHGGVDYWVVKLDTEGTIQWQKSYGGSGNDIPFSIQTTTDNGYIVAGQSYSTDGDVTGNHGNSDYWVIKLDVTGNLLWQKSLGGSNYDYSQSIYLTVDGGYVVAGQSNSTDGDVSSNYGSSDYWVVKLDATGNIQWQKTMGGLLADSAYSIRTASDGGYVVAGQSNSNDGDVSGNHGSSDYWVVKLAPDVLANSVFERQCIVVYPNPVCDVLQIQTPANTTITKAIIININGQAVLEQTENSNTINVENLSQGVYILEMYSDEEKYTSKFVKE